MSPQVFASPVWEKLSFKQVSEALRRDLSRLGVKDGPSVDTIIEYLKTPRSTLPDLDTAATWFEHLYLHGSTSVLYTYLHIVLSMSIKSCLSRSCVIICRQSPSYL